MSWRECCRCVMAFSAACQRHMMVQYCCDSGSTNKLFYRCFLLRQEARVSCSRTLHTDAAEAWTIDHCIQKRTSCPHDQYIMTSIVRCFPFFTFSSIAWFGAGILYYVANAWKKVAIICRAWCHGAKYKSTISVAHELYFPVYGTQVPHDTFEDIFLVYFLTLFCFQFFIKLLFLCFSCHL